MTNTLTDKELEAFLRELELNTLQKPLKSKQKETPKTKNLLLFTLLFFLFSMVLTAFALLYVKVNRLEKRIEVYETPLIFPQFSEEEIIEPMEPCIRRA